MALFTKTGEKTSAMLKPTGSGIVNVVGDFPWTISNNKGEVPVAAVTEYQINSGQLMAGLYYYGRQLVETGQSTLNNPSSIFRGGTTDEDPYRYMYFATPTGFNYLFPWLKEDKFARSNTFQHNEHMAPFRDISTALFHKASLSTTLDKAPKAPWYETLLKGSRLVADATKGATNFGSSLIPGSIGLNSSQSWTGTAGQAYTIEFDLLNTYTDSIRKNRELAYLLTYQNSPYRRNFAVVDPVCIYQLSIPDVVHFPACYVSNLSVSNVGNTRLLNIDGENRTIPEAYRFSITFTSLLEESRNIFWGIQNSNEKIKAIDTRTAFEALREAGDQLVDTINRVDAQGQQNDPNFVGPPNPLIRK